LAGDATHERQQLSALTLAAYGELRSAAASLLRRERPGHTLQATALVHELYLRLAKRRNLGLNDTGELIGVARHLMRRVLTDHGRRHKRAKRNAGQPALPLTEELAVPNSPRASIQLGEAIERLKALDPRQARVVDLRFFNGLSVPETAAALGISEKTVKREWATARAWLYRELHAGEV
jgi:RNA polymerase sigma factor (TIGR02999 family)